MAYHMLMLCVIHALFRMLCMLHPPRFLVCEVPLPVGKIYFNQLLLYSRKFLWDLIFIFLFKDESKEQNFRSGCGRLVWNGTC